MSTTNRVISVNESDLVSTGHNFINNPYLRCDGINMIDLYRNFDLNLYSYPDHSLFNDLMLNPDVNISNHYLNIKNFLKYDVICTFNKKICLDSKDKYILINVFNLPSFGLFCEEELDILYLIEKINPLLSGCREDCFLLSPYSSDIFSLYSLKDEKYNHVYYFINIEDSNVLKNAEAFRFEIFCLCEALFKILQTENIFYALFEKVVNIMITSINTGEDPSDESYKSYINRFSINDAK